MKRVIRWFGVALVGASMSVFAVAAPAQADGYCDPGVGITLQPDPGAGVVWLSAYSSNSCPPSWVTMSVYGQGGGNVVTYDNPYGSTAGDYYSAPLPYQPSSFYSAQVCAYEYTSDPLVGHACASTQLTTSPIRPLWNR